MEGQPLDEKDFQPLDEKEEEWRRRNSQQRKSSSMRSVGRMLLQKKKPTSTSMLTDSRHVLHVAQTDEDIFPLINQNA
jgi:hypothetical protein